MLYTLTKQKNSKNYEKLCWVIARQVSTPLRKLRFSTTTISPTTYLPENNSMYHMALTPAWHVVRPLSKIHRPGGHQIINGVA